MICDMDSDLHVFKAVLKSPEISDQKNRRSLIERSERSQYATCWMISEMMSEAESDDMDNNWDGFMEVGDERVKIKEMSDILASRFAFISGARTTDGYTILTFPDIRSHLSYDELKLLLSYLVQVPSLEEVHKGYVLVIDRRMDKWSNVRALLCNLNDSFSAYARVVFILKPESVFQRALEVGYKGITEGSKLKVTICQHSLELRQYVGADCLTMDVGGTLNYNHLEWVQHRMDIERMKSSAGIIAQSLREFGRCLKETELPNDVATTSRLLELHSAERDAIKEDFRISIRKGLSLLRSIRQIDVKPEHEQLSPTRLHNVTAIERMLVQLEETEYSFDGFWMRHEKRLTQCLKLRRFEANFRKLQSAFAKHMVYLEEHREVGNGPEKAEQFRVIHEEYSKLAMQDVNVAHSLRETGQELIALQDVELSGSILPKYDELGRMAEALVGALERRRQILQLSREMHEQILAANTWCKRGVDILTSIPIDLEPPEVSNALRTVDEFIADGHNLKLNALSYSPNMTTNLVLLTSTETSTLLAQVAERIDDIRRMSSSRRDSLRKIANKENCSGNQVQEDFEIANKSSCCMINNDESYSLKISSMDDQISYSTCDVQSAYDERKISRSEGGNSVVGYIIDELINTESTYVHELQTIIEFYIEPFETPENQSLIPQQLRDRSAIVFGNIRELYEFHNHCLLAEFRRKLDSIVDICHCFVTHCNRFLQIYLPYCQNKAMSEVMRRDFVHGLKFFTDCQKRAGHPLPLSAYLLKPIQRITKYQLLLKELRRHGSEDIYHHIDTALSSMLDLLAQLNAAMHQLHVSGYSSDLALLGTLHLQTECDIHAFKKKSRRVNKAQRRFLFLFDGGILICKKRSQPVPYAPEYYEHKLCIMTCNLGFADTSRTSSCRFDIWDGTKNEIYAVQPIEETQKERWIQRLHRVVTEKQPSNKRAQRPPSWASTVSSDSTNSAPSNSDTTSSIECSMVDPNGNQTVDVVSPASSSPTFVSSSRTSPPIAKCSLDLGHRVVLSFDDINKSTRSFSCPASSLNSTPVSPLKTIIENPLLAS